MTIFLVIMALISVGLIGWGISILNDSSLEIGALAGIYPLFGGLVLLVITVIITMILHLTISVV